MTILLDNVNVNTTSDEAEGDGGPKIIFIRADNFGDGSVEIQLAAPSDTMNRFEDLKDGIFRDNAEVHIDYIPVGTKIRVRLRGSSGAVNVFVEIA